MRRILRIFPAYFAFLAVSFSFRSASRLPMASWVGLGPPSLTRSTTTTRFIITPTTTIAHAWSLAVEEQFYLLWPLMFVFTPRRARGWSILAVSIVAVAGWRSLLYLHFKVGSAYVYNAFDTRFDNLAVGCLLAILCFNRPFQALFANRSPWIPLAPAFLVFASRAMTSLGYHYSVGQTVDAVLIGVFIVQIIQRPWSWLDHPTVRWLGTLSYPMYLYHAWGLGVAHKLVQGSAAVLLAGTATTVVLASCSYYLLETRILRLKSRFQTSLGEAKVFSQIAVASSNARSPEVAI